MRNGSTFTILLPSFAAFAILFTPSYPIFRSTPHPSQSLAAPNKLEAWLQWIDISGICLPRLSPFCRQFEGTGHCYRIISVHLLLEGRVYPEICWNMILQEPFAQNISQPRGSHAPLFTIILSWQFNSSSHFNEATLCIIRVEVSKQSPNQYLWIVMSLSLSPSLPRHFIVFRVYVIVCRWLDRTGMPSHMQNG